jgi:replicative DNA helicase
MTTEKLPSNELAEAVTLGACLIQPDTIVSVSQETTPSDFTVPVFRWLAGALWECLEQHTPPTLPVIIGYLESAKRWAGDRPSQDGVCYEDLRKCQLAATDTDIDFARQNAKLIRRAAFRRNGYQAVAQASRVFLDIELDETQIQQRVSQTIEQSFDGVTYRSSDLASIEAEEQKRLANPRGNDGIPCGVRWLDDLTGGFQQAENWVISGAYKARKTTVALNMMLAAAKSGAGVAMFTNGDSTRDATYRKLLAMEMTLRMGVRPEFRSEVSARTLQHPLGNFEYAKLRTESSEFLKTLRIRLYDGRDMIGNLAETGRIMRRDALLHGIQVFFYDYAQTIVHGTGDYEKVTYYAAWAQNITGELGVPMVTLSQKSEESIKGNLAGSYSPGAKGGGALPAMANVFLETAYVEPMVSIEVKLARDCKAGEKIQHRVAPASGLILDGMVKK